MEAKNFSAILNRFKKLAVFTTVSTYFLIFVGGLVRVSGAGLGCPDWPKCFGKWIPPLSKQGLPPEFNAQTFNVTLAWIEYVNRLIGVVVGLLILGTALMAVLYFRNQRRLVIPAVLAAVLVGFQGWFGSIVVSSHLEPLLVSLHLILALIIVGLLIYTTQTAFHMHNGDLPPISMTNKPTRRWVLILWAAVIVQVLLGTQVRSQIEIVQSQFPLLTGLEALQQIGEINYIHSILGLIITALAVITAFMLIQKHHFRSLAVIIIILPFIQVISGSAMQLFGLAPLIQVFHLWMASIATGVLLITYSELLYHQE